MSYLVIPSLSGHGRVGIQGARVDEELVPVRAEDWFCDQLPEHGMFFQCPLHLSLTIVPCLTHQW